MAADFVNNEMTYISHLRATIAAAWVTQRWLAASGPKEPQHSGKAREASRSCCLRGHEARERNSPMFKACHIAKNS